MIRLVRAMSRDQLTDSIAELGAALTIAEAERDATPILDPLRIVKTTRVESYKRLLAIAQTKLRILDAEIGARA